MSEGAVLIPSEMMPVAVSHFIWVHAPWLLDVPCSYAILKDGSLLVTPIVPAPMFSTQPLNQAP